MLKSNIKNQKNKYILLLGFLLFVILISSCGIHKQTKTISYKKMNTTSEIILPFSIDKMELTRFLESYLPDTLFESKKEDNLPVTLKVYKGELKEISPISGLLSAPPTIVYVTSSSLSISVITTVEPKLTLECASSLGSTICAFPKIS